MGGAPPASSELTRTLFDRHPVVGHVFQPSISARDRLHAYGPSEQDGTGFLLRTNAAGFRSSREFEPRKAPGVFRVLLFGNSYTEGFGVSNEYRYGDLLEQMIPGLEVYNFGIRATGTDQHYLTYREMATGYEHDLVIIASLVENIVRNVARYAQLGSTTEIRVFERPYFTLEEDGRLELHGVPLSRDPIPHETLSAAEREMVAFRAARWHRARRIVGRIGPRAKDVLQRVARRQPIPGYESPNDPAWLLMKAILQQWVAELSTPAVLVTLPLYQHTEGMASPAHYRARFAELHDPPALTVHDTLSDLARYSRTERRAFRFAIDSHYTRAGHRAVAESLAPVIRAAMARAEREAPAELALS